MTNYAASSAENLRIVRGCVNPIGGITGTGFTVVSNSVGDWTINFTLPFSGSGVATFVATAFDPATVSLVAITTTSAVG